MKGNKIIINNWNPILQLSIPKLLILIPLKDGKGTLQINKIITPQNVWNNKSIPITEIRPFIRLWS